MNYLRIEFMFQNDNQQDFYCPRSVAGLNEYFRQNCNFYKYKGISNC